MNTPSLSRRCAFTRRVRADGDKTFMEFAPLPNEVEKDTVDTQQTEWAVNLLNPIKGAVKCYGTAASAGGKVEKPKAGKTGRTVIR